MEKGLSDAPVRYVTLDDAETKPAAKDQREPREIVRPKGYAEFVAKNRQPEPKPPKPTLGQRIATTVKDAASSVGTGLSDADREYAEKIAGGKVSLTKDSIKKLLDINRRISIFHVTDYNRRAEQAMKKEGGDQLPYDLRVNMPQRKKRIVERRVSPTGKTLVKYDDGTIGEE